MRERLMISVTFDPERGYVTAGGELPVLAALSLTGLRRKLEDAHRGEDVEIRLVLDRAARLYLISTSIGASHAIFDAPLKGTSTLFFKAQASILVALAGQFALLAGFISANLSSRQVVLGRRSVPISAILDIRGP